MLDAPAISYDVALAREHADLYRARGFNPLPSRSDEKRPLIRFRDLWEQKLPKELFDAHEPTNIQVMTGRHWGLLVIDLDGEGGKVWWRERTGSGALPRTWITHSGGDGLHLWFSIMDIGLRPMPKAFLWKSADGEKHSAVERLCDRSLIMAPPSIHPRTGERYRFLDKYHAPLSERNPRGLHMPRPCPPWVLNHPTLSIRREDVAAVQPHRERPAVEIRGRIRDRYTARDVKAAIPDKLSLVRSWGVRVVGGPNELGWAPCHAIDRPDVHPSAAVNAESGTYVDLGSGARLGLLDLGITLGIYHDFKSALADLGSRYVGTR